MLSKQLIYVVLSGKAKVLSVFIRVALQIHEALAWASSCCRRKARLSKPRPPSVAKKISFSTNQAT